MELDIEVKWTQQDIEQMLRERLEKEGLLLIPQPKTTSDKDENKEEDTGGNQFFVWPRRGKVKVKARAVISPRAQRNTKDAELTVSVISGTEDVPLDPEMFPDGTNMDVLEAAVKQRPLMAGESHTPPIPRRPVGR